MKSKTKLFVFALSAMMSLAAHGESVKPLKALLVLGGCCHDYKVQKDLLKAGIEARANITIDVCYSAATNTTPEFECYAKDNWAEGYDVVIHDECAAGIKDLVMINRILEPHRKGLPGVNLHCAMHSYRGHVTNLGQPQQAGTDGAIWFEYLGLQSTGHGKQIPIAVSYLPGSSPIVAGLENWTTIKEELYNNIQVFVTAKPVARGLQEKQDNIVGWTNEYGANKTRVFSTTLGHNNETVSDAKYLDFVTRGLLWSCGKLGDDGKPLAGYAGK
jgi:hypothetical protein